MKVGIVKFSEIASHPGLRLDASYWLASEEERRLMDEAAGYPVKEEEEE